MELTAKLLTELQRRLKVGNRRGVHLNAIPANSRYKFDLNRLSYIDKSLPINFINSLLIDLPLKFKITWKDNVPDLNSLFEEDQTQLVKITKSFENLINQTEAIESEKGINTFGFGFPVLVRRDKADNKLTIAPVLIWSLRIKRTREFNTWEILRNEDDPIYLNEVLINHLQSDSGIEIDPIPSEMLDDGLINKTELVEILVKLINSVNSSTPGDLKETFTKKIELISSIGDKAHYEKLPLNSTNSFIDFGGLFSIFEVQKQNIINDYNKLMDLEGININLDNLDNNSFQPISAIETDPSQQSILHSLETTRNILIQGPPGTGKSQTLTAVLINALENNKKTIVVCEKRTALEVLHNALIEKGLNYHTVLIKDIVKDRKTVVDSVRERIDNSEYRRYTYNYSKDTLNNFVSRAKDLISNINYKHLKLDEKIIGNKTWTTIVGELLKELKDSEEDYNLNIENPDFDFNTQELNELTHLFQIGEYLFNEYTQNINLSFINPIKLCGENPYLIEQQINEDFEIYNKQVFSINEIFESIEKEYLKIRRDELNSQIQDLNNAIDSINSVNKDFIEISSQFRQLYLSLRTMYLEQQVNKIHDLISIIEGLFKKNSNSPELLNEQIFKSFKYKFQSLFSSGKKQLLSDHNKLKKTIEELSRKIESSKDFCFLQISGDIKESHAAVDLVKNEIKKTKNSFLTIVDNELTKLNLPTTVLNLNDGNNQISKVRNLLIDAGFGQLLMDSLDINLKQFETGYELAQKNINSIKLILTTDKDLNKKVNFTNEPDNNKQVLLSIKEIISNVSVTFESKLNLEFRDLLYTNDGLLEYLEKLPSLPILNLKIKELVDKIINDEWVLNPTLVMIQCSTKADESIYKYLELTDAIKVLLDRKKEYFDSENDLFTIDFKWFQFYNKLKPLHKKTVDELKQKKNWRKTFLSFYLNSILNKAATIDLPTSDIEHVELKKALKSIESEQYKFIKEFWYSKQIDSTKEFEQKNTNLSVENLYNKRSSSKYKRLSLRQIVQYDADLFSNFFPIILTSPDVASNLFKGMNGYFDIVMFDEASQLRLEDNLPAILKGKQVVIAGDEHQMPPSNYFSKVFDGIIEDEEDYDEEEKIVVDKEDILLSCESLLDFGSELNFQKKHLDFHYRSRHPYLIDFSNYAFYNQRLKPLPNNFEYIPIKYIQVNGTFSEHTNEAEAETVLSIIDNNINRLPNGKYPTVGIATFNITQRNLIKSKILERQKFSKFDLFNAKIQELEENGLFIKNLENIQGDERDVIILSTTYGVGKDGKFAQRFGPINHSKGYKLLNVIITRAKYKVYVCSSIPEQVFMNYKEYLITEGSNNKRAVFYAYLAYCKSVSESNNDLRLGVLTTLAENTTKSTSFDSYRGSELESPFEEEVYQSLVDHFGDKKLIPQLQFAGFRIDLVYDPKIKGVPKIAIECDGAKYHSSQEAYLYDRHRQKILERHGFLFHRIWSTNWWRNSNREAKKLIEFIKKVEDNRTHNIKDRSKTKNAFTDDIVIIENYIKTNSFINVEEDSGVIQSLDQNEIEQQKIVNVNGIKINSKVVVKYMNNGKELSVQLVTTENNKVDGSDFQKIYYKSALAIAITGHIVGEIVKVGSLDNFVEIVKVS
jgi:very-short-patch-repair endonuclease